MPRVAGTVNIFTIPWGEIEVNGKERKTSEKGKRRNLKLKSIVGKIMSGNKS